MLMQTCLRKYFKERIYFSCFRLSILQLCWLQGRNLLSRLNCQQACQPLAGWMTPPGSLPPTPPAFSPNPADLEHSVMFGFPNSLMPRHTVIPATPQYQQGDDQHPPTSLDGADSGPLSPTSTINLLMDRRWGFTPNSSPGITPVQQDVRQALLQQAAAGLWHSTFLPTTRE